MNRVITTLWVRCLAPAWRQRDETGGVSDDTAMIGIMLGAAVLVGTGIAALVTGAVDRLELGF